MKDNFFKADVDMAKLYSNTFPSSGDVIGVIKVGYRTGALVRMQGTGLYVLVNADSVTSLDQRLVREILSGKG